MKYVKYFTKNFMTDRLIMALIVLCGAAIIVVIVVACLGEKKKYVYIAGVPDTSASDSTADVSQTVTP
jgi:hypothetical protein